MGFENPTERIDASSPKAEVLRETLTARYDPRLTVSRKSQGLSLIKFRVLKSSDTRQPIQHSGWQVSLFDVDKIAHHDTSFGWQWAGDSSILLPS
jgi:hypothetical protein